MQSFSDKGNALNAVYNADIFNNVVLPLSYLHYGSNGWLQ
jgi:hypothetical protein